MNNQPVTPLNVPRLPSNRISTSLWKRLPCCANNTDRSNPFRPRDPSHSGYWLLISMVLLALVMVVPFLKGLFNVISAYTNLLIFVFVFFFRKPEAMVTMAMLAIVLAHSFFGVAMYIHYVDPYASCEPLLMIGVRSPQNPSFCHERSFEILSILAGAVWLLIGGCLARFVELRRAELAVRASRQRNRRQQQQQQQRAEQNITALAEQP